MRKIVREALQKAGLDPRRHCIAVTGEGSPMDNPEEYLRSFYMFDYIGWTIQRHIDGRCGHARVLSWLRPGG